MDMERRSERGVTLIEMLVAITIMSVITLLFYSLVTGTMNANTQLEAHAILSSYGQRAINMMKSEVAQSKRIYENDTFGNALLSRVTLPSAYPRASGTRLPVIEGSKTSFSTVPTGSVGNSLFFLEDYPPFVYNNKYYIDLYKFIYYYLTEKNAGDLRIANLPKYLDLVRFESNFYASYDQIMKIPNDPPDRDGVLSALNAAGVHYVVDTAAPSVNDMFYRNSGSSLTKETSHQIGYSEAKPFIRILSEEKVTARLRYTIAYNRSSNFPILTPVPKYATETDRPFGFEILVIGPTSAREVLLRLVFAAQIKYRLFSQPMEVVVQAKEY